MPKSSRHAHEAHAAASHSQAAGKLDTFADVQLTDGAFSVLRMSSVVPQQCYKELGLMKACIAHHWKQNGVSLK